MWITTHCGKLLKRWEYKTTLPVSWKTHMWVKKQLLEPDRKQRTGINLGKEYVKAVYWHLAYLTSMQNTSCKILGWMKHKLELRLPGEISTTSDTQMISLSSTLATWCEELTHWKRPWCWEGLKVEGEGDDRGWDGWMASPSQWIWVWVNSGSSWWTGRPGMLQSEGSQRVGHD